MSSEYTLKRYLKDEIIFVDSNKPVVEIYQLMQRHNIRHLPVIDEQSPVGVISDRDVKFVSYSDQITNLVAKDIMSESPYCVSDQAQMKEVVKYMAAEKLGSALILNQTGEIKGIFTSTDALHLLSEIL